jgi:hypothetical protein
MLSKRDLCSGKNAPAFAADNHGPHCLIYANYTSTETCNEAEFKMQSWLAKRKWDASELHVYVKQSGFKCGRGKCVCRPIPKAKAARCDADWWQEVEEALPVTDRAPDPVEAHDLLPTSGDPYPDGWKTRLCDFYEERKCVKTMEEYRDGCIRGEACHFSHAIDWQAGRQAGRPDVTHKIAQNKDNDQGEGNENLYLHELSSFEDDDGSFSIAGCCSEQLTAAEEQERQELDEALEEAFLLQQEASDEPDAMLQWERQKSDLEMTKEIQEEAEAYFNDVDPDSQQAIRRKMLLERVCGTVGQDVLQKCFRRVLLKLKDGCPYLHSDQEYQLEVCVSSKSDSYCSVYHPVGPVSVKINREVLESTFGEGGDTWQQLKVGDTLLLWAQYDDYSQDQKKGRYLTASTAKMCAGGSSQKVFLKSRCRRSKIELSLGKLLDHLAVDMSKKDEKEWDTSLLCNVLKFIPEISEKLKHMLAASVDDDYIGKAAPASLALRTLSRDAPGAGFEELSLPCYPSLSPQHQSPHSPQPPHSPQKPCAVKVLVEKLYKNAPVDVQAVEWWLRKLESDVVAALDLLRLLRNHLHHDNDNFTSGLVPSSFEHLFSLAQQAILTLVTLSSVADDEHCGNATVNVRSKLAQLRGELARQHDDLIECHKARVISVLDGIQTLRDGLGKRLFGEKEVEELQQEWNKCAELVQHLLDELNPQVEALREKERRGGKADGGGGCSGGDGKQCSKCGQCKGADCFSKKQWSAKAHSRKCQACASEV